MQRCKLELSIIAEITLDISDADDVRRAEHLISWIKSGTLPPHFEILVKEKMKYQAVELIDADVPSLEPGPEDELNFDM